MGLLIPHFSLGLGIGTLDAALIPYMATLVDLKYGDDESTASKFLTIFWGTIQSIPQTLRRTNQFLRYTRWSSEFLYFSHLRWHDIQLRIGICYSANFRQLGVFIGTNPWWRNGAIFRILLVNVNCRHFECPLWINVACFAGRLEKQCNWNYITRTENLSSFLATIFFFPFFFQKSLRSNKEILLNEYEPSNPHKRFYNSMDVP